MTRAHRLSAWLLAAGLYALAVGCGGGSSSTTPLPGSGPPTKGEPGASEKLSPELAKGRAVFEAKMCGNCHMIHGQKVAGQKGGGGPDLGTVGSDSSHTPAWIADHIRNPRSHKPSSKMPASDETKISAADLKLLSEYLASLK